MNEHPVPADTAEAKAAAELAQLELQVEAARAVLIRLLQDVVEAESHLGSTQAAQLVNGTFIGAASRLSRSSLARARVPSANDHRSPCFIANSESASQPPIRCRA